MDEEISIFSSSLPPIFHTHHSNSIHYISTQRIFDCSSTLSISSFPDRFFLSLVVSTTFSSCSALYCYCIEELMMSSLIEMKTLLN